MKTDAKKATTVNAVGVKHLVVTGYNEKDKNPVRFEVLVNEKINDTVGMATYIEATKIFALSTSYKSKLKRSLKGVTTLSELKSALKSMPIKLGFGSDLIPTKVQAVK